MGETATESLAGYAWDEKHDGKHEDGRHDALYPHGNKHAKHGKDSTYAYRIVETVRTFTYDGAGKLLSATETEENQGTYTYAYGYDAMGNRTSAVKTDENGKVVESSHYAYNESSQLVSVELYNGKKTTTVTYSYDADGNLISETGRDGTEKVEKTYLYAVENRLLAVYDGKELLMAAAYDGDGNRVFQLNYNLHTDGDLKGNNGNGNGSNKDNGGSGNSGNNGNGNNGNGNGSGFTAGGSNGSGGNSSGSGGGSAPTESVTGTAKNNGNAGNSSANNGKGGNGKDNGNKGNNGNGNNGNGNGNSGNNGNSGSGNGSSGSGNGSTGNGNATNAETNSSQNQCGILFPTDSEVSAKEAYLISLIKTSGKEKDYELIEYISDVNRTHAEVLVEQNCNGAMDTAYVYGTDRLSLDRFDGSTGYYLYDPKGSVTGITNGEGQICLSYRYSAFGEITYGAPQYENIYAYNGESYNPNVGSLYLRARYYNVAAGAFFTEDSYLGNIREPLTLNRYVYCVGNPVNYVDPSGHIMLGNTDMPGFVRGEVNGETVFYFPDSFSDYAENRLAEKAEENRRFMDGVEEFLLYNPVGQGISAASSALLFPVTGPAVLLRDQHLANTYGEARDEMADFFEVNNNLLAGFAGSFHGTYQLLKDPAYLVFGAAYIIEKPNETIFRDPLERPLAMVDAFWEGDNKDSVKYAGQAIGYAVQFAVQAAISRQVIQSCKKPKVQDKEIAKTEVFEDYMDLVEKLDVSTKSDTAIFYSGPGNRALAEEFARLNDKMTLEMTSGGAYLDGLQLFENYSPLTQQEAINVWARLSARYAQSASGNVYGFVNGSWSESIFNMVEYPELLKNSNVTNIFTEFMK